MRIIIVQAEIEEAIKQYIFNQLEVKEGQEINIDFKATRGEDGATADINIGPVKAPATKTPVTRAVREKSVETGTTQNATESVSEAQVDETKPEEPEAAAQVVVTENGSVESASEASNEVAEPDPNAKPSTSLFASMKRPVNG